MDFLILIRNGKEKGSIISYNAIVRDAAVHRLYNVSIIHDYHVPFLVIVIIILDNVVHPSWSIGRIVDDWNNRCDFDLYYQDAFDVDLYVYLRILDLENEVSVVFEDYDNI